MKLNFKSFGSGDPVVILHGLFGSLDNWQTFAKRMAEHYQVFIVDQRDHGKSPHTVDFNYQLLAEDLKEFLEQQWIYEARLIGHSMGGRTVMNFALEYPDMVQQMVVVDMGVKTYTGGHEDIIAALNKVEIENVTSRSEVDAQLSESIQDQGVRLFLMKNLARKKEGGYRWKMNLDLLTKKYPEIMQGLPQSDPSEVEALFVKGVKSNYILTEDKPQIKSYFPDAKISSIADAGHWIHAEQPDALYKVLIDFFRQNGE